MVEITPSQGYDNPIALRENDHLNRWPFAKEIFNIVTTAPSDWSVRIGIYGAWGTGKTSVLNFIKIMAQSEKHIVVNFNPWAFRTNSEMWEDLTLKIYEALTEAGVKVENYKETKTKAAIKEIGELINDSKLMDSLTKLKWFGIDISAQVTKAGISTLTGFLKLNSDKLKQAINKLADRRIIILIDDLDRTDLHILPEILYALREVLDLPGVIFIMAFDPTVVGEALKQHHPGWGDGKRFLEKIIDFPRQLPSPTKRQLLNLIKNDIKEHGDFINTDALEQICEFLPDNPRKLRSFIRSLWGLKQQVERHYSFEIEWADLLLIQLLKFHNSDFADEIFKDEKFFNVWHDTLNIFNTDNEAIKQKQNKAKEEVDKFYEKYNINIKEREDFAKILEKIYRPFRNIFQKRIADISVLVKLVEEPPVWTWREVDEILEEYSKAFSTDDLTNLINKQSQKLGINQNETTLIFLFEKLVNYWSYLLQEASESKTNQSKTEKMEQVNNIIHLLETIGFNLNGFVSEKPFLNSKHFFSVLEIASTWVHWKNTEVDRFQRNKELNLLRRIATETTISPIVLIEILQPWNVSRISRISSFYQNDKENLYKELDPIIEEKAVAIIPDLIKLVKFSELDSNCFSDNALNYLILRHDSLLWIKNRFRQAFLETVSTAHLSFIIQENLLFLFNFWKEKISQENNSTQFIQDPEIIETLWRGALACPINPRFISEYNKIRETIENKIPNLTLHKPPDWEQWLPNHPNAQVTQD